MRIRRRNVAPLAGVCAIAAFSARAFAAPAPTPAPAPIVQAVLDCRGLPDATERVACYDKAVDGMAKAQTTGDLVTIDREQRRAVRRQAFGLTLPALSMFDVGEKPEEVNRIKATVKSASQDPYKKWIIILEDGGVWRQVEAGEVDNPPHPGSTVAIRKAALGSFFMNIDGQSAIRVRRDN
jgi:hypothetical protein